MDNGNFKSMESKESKTCTLRNCDSVNFSALFDVTNSAGSNKIRDWNFASAEASVKYLKNMTDIDSSIDQKEIVKINCAVSGICENSGTAYLPEKISNQTVTTDPTGISEVTYATGIDSETTDATEIISETTANTLIRSVMTDAIGISIIITDVTGIGSETTDVKGTSSEMTDGVVIRSETIKFPEISNETTGLAVILNETIKATEVISETTDSLRIRSETTDSLRICSETTDSMSEPDVKADNIATGTITLGNYPYHVFTAHNITECKGRYLKVPEKICKQFAKSTGGRTCEPIEKANNKKSIQTKDISVDNCERKNRHKQTHDIEKFLDAVNLTNKDMVRKSGILLQKQNLVAEVLSYVHAVQSIFRLSTPRCLFTNRVPRDSEANVEMSSNKQFYEAGEFILEELKHYQSELKADFQDWEAFRIKIWSISERLLYDFELCENEKSSRVLMHGITTEICTILRNMEIISSKREEKNEECIDLMGGVDTYIKYSSAFIMGNNTLTLL